MSAASRLLRNDSDDHYRVSMRRVRRGRIMRMRTGRARSIGANKVGGAVTELGRDCDRTQDSINECCQERRKV